MRNLSTALTNHLAARGGLHARLLIWITARNRSTGAAESIGFWTGDDHREISIDGTARTYYGAGSLISMAPITTEAGVTVRTHRLMLSPIAPEVAQAVRGYDTRLAPCELHVAYFDPLSHEPIDTPVRVFKGTVDGAPINTPEAGGEATCELALLSSAHALTRKLALKKSDQSLRQRAAGDGFRKYTDLSGAIETAWGEARRSGPPPAPPPPPAKSDGERDRR